MHLLLEYVNYTVIVRIVVQCHYLFNEIVKDDTSRTILTYSQLANLSPQIQEQHEVSQVLSY